MNALAETVSSGPAEPWRRRLTRHLLYGRDNNRGAKARART
jgi:hypothetical protein